MTAPAILHCLRERFGQAQIYSAVGSIIVAINPFETLPLYAAETLGEFSAWYGFSSAGLPRRVLSPSRPLPHVFGTAAGAYSALRRGGCNQSIVISGESGSGKTESTKHILRFLASASGAAAVGSSSDSVSSLLEQQILQSNPVVESFGNATTACNDNSSRFGKLVAIHFDSGGAMIRGQLVRYLLEQGRVVRQAAAERNFHVFYQLLAAMAKDEPLAATLRLRSLVPPAQHEPSGFAYLSAGLSCVDGIDDIAQWTGLLAALRVLNIEDKDVSAMMAALLAVLCMGNTNFEPATAEGGMLSIDAESKPWFEQCTANLGLSPQQGLLLMQAMVARQVCVNKGGGGGKSQKSSIIYVARTHAQVLDARDALAKAIYASVFDWIVSQINVAWAAGCGATSAKQGSALTLNVLDIFGFECFQTNSFEQFCINYCNEKLQHFFGEHVVSQELEAYREDGIDIAALSRSTGAKDASGAFFAFENNAPCLDMLEASHVGMFALVDEETRLPKGSDAALLTKILSRFATTPLCRARTTSRGRRRGGAGSAPVTTCSDVGQFSVAHYAGEVVYEVAGFLDKNRHGLHDDFKSCLRRSNSSFVLGLDVATEVSGAIDTGGMLPRGRRSSDLFRRPTIGTRFKRELGQLVAILGSSTPHFIRCIRPNKQKQPGVFDSVLVLQQMQAAGLVTICRVRQVTLPVRFCHQAFVQRFWCLAGSSYVKGSVHSTSTERVNHLLRVLATQGHLVADADGRAQFAQGTHKIFLRMAQAETLNAARDLLLPDFALLVQQQARARRARVRMKRYLAVLADLVLATSQRNCVSLRALLATSPTRSSDGSMQFNCESLPYGGKHLEAVLAAEAALRRLDQEIAIDDKLQPLLQDKVAANLGSLLAGVQEAELLSPPHQSDTVSQARALAQELQENAAKQEAAAAAAAAAAVAAAAAASSASREASAIDTAPKDSPVSSAGVKSNDSVLVDRVSAERAPETPHSRRRRSSISTVETRQKALRRMLKVSVDAARWLVNGASAHASLRSDASLLPNLLHKSEKLDMVEDELCIQGRDLLVQLAKMEDALVHRLRKVRAV